MERPIEAYRGDEPYVFVCYSHDDKAMVYEEIAWLHEQGVNVWYDEGISPGEEWSEELGQAIDGAERLIYFVSPRSVASRHCRNELNFAQNHDKSILSVYLEETALPSGVELVISAAQAIVKPDFTEADYRARLLRALGRATESPRARQTRIGPTEAVPPTSRVPWRLPALLLLAVSVVVAIWLLERLSEDRGKVTDTLDRSLAVLPLAVVGRDPVAATYAEALTEELRAVVAGYHELRTVAVPDTVGAHEVDQASYVLGGSVQRLDEGVLLRTNLARTDDRHTVWAETFERPVTDSTPDAAELATTVGRFVRHQLIMDQRCESVRRTTASQEAAAYHCAAVRESHHARGMNDYRMALDQAQRAVALDPGIADAHVLVGLNYVWFAEAGQMDWRDALRQAREALDRAFALASDNPHAVGLQGRIEQLEMNYPSAEASLRKAIELEPLSPIANAQHGRLGMVVLSQGRLDEALEHYRRALRLDDSNGVAYMTYAGALWSAGEYDEAIRAADAGLRLVNSGFVRAYLYVIKAAALVALGETVRANALIDEALADVGSELKPVLAVVLALVGRTVEAREIVSGLEKLEQPPIAVMIETYAALGDDRAFEWMHTAIDRHMLWTVGTLRTSPLYAGLRNDPRWAEVIAHLETEEAKGRAGGSNPS